jgi:hypothetical protein
MEMQQQMTSQEQTQYFSEQSSASEQFEKAKTHRVILTSREGKSWANLSVLVAVILTLILPELVALLVLVALVKGGNIAISSTEKAKNSEYQQIV